MDNYLVSVADAIVRDPIADVVAFRGTALIQSAFNQTMSAQEVRAGFGNGLKFVYNHSKKLDVSLEASTFEESFIVMNNGSSIVNGLQNYYVFDEVVTLVAGTGSLNKTPIGNVYVQPATGGILQTITPSGQTFAVTGGANTTVKVSYRYSTTVDRILIDAASVPVSYELTLRAKVFTAAGQTQELTMTIPQWKIQGNFQLQLTASGVSTSKIDGMALNNPTDNALAYVDLKNIGATNIAYTDIVGSPSAVSLSASSTSQQLTVYGVRGGVYSNVVLTPSCTFVSGTPATCTVGSTTGLIQRVAAGSSVITITHTASGLTDTVTVTST